jgi:adenylate cyclase
MSQSRQLPAIMFTDIVGYTAMMQEDEQSAVTTTKRYVSVLKHHVALHGGEILNDYGDGSLCTFSSATEAIRCAMGIQQQLQGAPKVPLRIGLHIGEVFFEDGKIFGDGVNVASRIQSIGVANSILFSSEISSKLANQPEFSMDSMGKFLFKNVSVPVEVFALTNDGLAVPDKGKIEGKLAEKKNSRSKSVFIATLLLLAAVSLFVYRKFATAGTFTGKEKSIAVLPFENISNDTLQQYFSDGITEDIITQLSKIADLKVISRTSVMQYKNTTKTIGEIAKELHVAAILEGSVRKEGGNVRINAQLIDANTDQHIWADQYDRDASEVFAIQSEVAQRIANQLNVKLTADEGNRIQKKATQNLAAYEDYLKARKLPYRQREPLLLSALKKDSSFALAWADLALLYSKMPARNSADVPFYIRKSLDAALTAVYYGPDLSETHMILGDVLKTITLNPALSIKELNKSISLNPNNSEAYAYLAYTQIELGMFKEAELNLNKSVQLDPISGLTRGGWFNLYLYSRNPGKLLEFIMNQPINVREGLMADRKRWYYFLKDDYDSILLNKNTWRDPVLKGISYAKTGKAVEARKIVDSLTALSLLDHAFDIGIIHAWLGEKQKAMEYLNLAYRLYDYNLVKIKVDKLFDPLRDDESFKELLRKMEME